MARHLEGAVAGLVFAWGPVERAVGLCLGLRAVDAPGSADDVLGEAAAAAALAGPGRPRLYRSGDRERAAADPGGGLWWARRVAAALGAGGAGLGLAVQPLEAVDGAGGETWAECLVRWTGDGPPVAAAAFVPAVTWAGDGAALDRWVLGRVLDGLPGPPDAPRRLSVNLGAGTLDDPGFPDWLRARLGPDVAARLGLEVPESLVLARPDRALALRRAARELGVAFILDGAGSTRVPAPLLEALAPELVKVALEPGVAAGAELRCRAGAVRALGAGLVVKGVADPRGRDQARAAGADWLQGRAVAAEAPW
jgi:EAL domain-containing protein (putative c-di-GMP-specific phosphodiesterase class I)